MFYPTCRWDVCGLPPRVPPCNTLICIRIKLMPFEMKTPELAVKMKAKLKRVAKNGGRGRWGW